MSSPTPAAAAPAGRCPVTVEWFGYDVTTRCVRPAGHGGAHRDGVWWFDDHGLRVPAPEPVTNRRRRHGREDTAGWKERKGQPRSVHPSIARRTEEALG